MFVSLLLLFFVIWMIAVVKVPHAYDTNTKLCEQGADLADIPTLFVAVMVLGLADIIAGATGIICFARIFFCDGTLASMVRAQDRSFRETQMEFVFLFLQISVLVISPRYQC